MTVMYNEDPADPSAHEPRVTGAEQTVLPVTRYRDADGNPACAVDFAAGLVCRFYTTQRFGLHETCVFAQKVGPRGMWQPLERRKSGDGTLIPLDACPVWPDAEVTGPDGSELNEGLSAWQPIETAPRDGTWILLAGGECSDDSGGTEQRRVVTGQWTNYRNGCTGKQYERWQFAWHDGGYDGEYKQPTHWMPVPPLRHGVRTKGGDLKRPNASLSGCTQSARNDS